MCMCVCVCTQRGKAEKGGESSVPLTLSGGAGETQRDYFNKCLCCVSVVGEEGVLVLKILEYSESTEALFFYELFVS